MSYGNQKSFDDRRICEECEKPFLYATEITEEIEGKPYPCINDEHYEGFYCWTCIEKLEKIDDRI